MHAFDVLGDPVRRRILELIADSEQTSGVLTTVIHQEFGVSQPGCSSTCVCGARMGSPPSELTRRLYAVDCAPLEAADMWLQPFRRFWDQHLDALATELARGKRQGRLKVDTSPSTKSKPRTRKREHP